jgi:DnaJ-class molecular chaperone
MQALCMTCEGSGIIATAKHTIHGSAMTTETCRTCHGARFYDAAKGPGVDHDLPHGSGSTDAR